MQSNILKDFLMRRKITESVITDFCISWGQHKVLGECIIIPIYDEHGKFSFNKYRRNPLSDLKPKYLYDQGGKLTLYGFYKYTVTHVGTKYPPVIITEGEMDSLVCWSANIPAVSSTGGAMAFNEEMAALLKDREVIISFDNDEAGGKGMAKVLDLLPTAKILLLPDRPGIKDISDYVANGGDLHKLLKSAKSFSGIDEVIEDRANRIALWQSTHFHDAYIKNHTEIPKEEYHPSNKDLDLLECAKQRPIDTLLKFNPQYNTNCLWHNEDSPSMHYYKKNNRVYCFGCGKSADAVDVYMQIHNCSFLDAVKALQ